MKHLLLWLIKAYQYLLSPWVGGQCRFHPTCSEYARIAIELHGPVKGGWLAVRRLLRCHPYSGRWGFDPVPGSMDDSDRQGNRSHPELNSCLELNCHSDLDRKH